MKISDIINPESLLDQKLLDVAEWMFQKGAPSITVNIGKGDRAVMFAICVGTSEVLQRAQEALDAVTDNTKEDWDESKVAQEAVAESEGR